MSLLQEIANFNPGILRPTETVITTLDFCQRVERRSASSGAFVVQKGPLSFGVGLVLDLTDDTQIAQILPFLFLGSQAAAFDLKSLKSLGISHVLNCASGIPNYYPDDFEYLQLEVWDASSVSITQHIEDVFQFIEGAQLSPPGGKVLVHCNAGVSRSAAFVMAYLIKKYKMSAEDAYRRVKEARLVANPNEGFRKQLDEYANREACSEHDVG